MRDAESVTFAGGSIDRAAHLRGDAAGLAALAAGASARVLPLSRGRPLVSGAAEADLAWLPADHPLFATPAPMIFLGLEEDAPRFAREIPDWPALAGEEYAFTDQEGEAHPDLPPSLRFHELRSLMARLTPAEAGNAAAAKGILAWHEGHRFCARCGQPSEIADAGWKRICPACGAQHFPRTDPVVIMLITHGNSVLLGRSAAWPPGMYSLLAGFMEPGESIEAAVRRETWEETGIRVGEVGYLASQPWPFPSSLMLGCRGEALGREIRRDPNEIEDARWLTREEAMRAAAGLDPDIRPARKGSIARFLIDRWLADTLD
ncbi:NAD(+) diphosphatase [Amaricoccus solimangrovi]|uniref:NAD(+) diphosphatase n=1 Tax=Amaricoccus solimangrovi TaxID=2589815 RepID=A0A501WLN1_9RHOB|nr:NAD(+) diphosphatase [Amaricoccus solimangrovi]TPE46576.1 NAD(+) diphosphatase [Amaricoccus solimangrovi]